MLRVIVQQIADSNAEQKLETHDLAVPLPRPGDNNQKEFFCIILLSSVDTETSSPQLARIQRLYHQNGGRNVGLVFLLKEKGSRSNGTIEFMKLGAR